MMVEMSITIHKKPSTLFRILGHPKRLEIVCLLHGHELTVNQIVQMTKLRQAAVSQHLMVLKAHRFAKVRQIGKEMYYTLALDQVVNLSLFLDHLTKVHPFASTEPTVIDPVCHMQLTPATAAYTAEYAGVRHYFCGKGCLATFERSKVA
jgi:DNA-binding transcriptional ArsR family regulator